MRPISSLTQGAILAGTGGMLDAFTYVGHGHVFANSMTGNVVLLGINLMAGGWQQSLRHLLPILSFFLGISTARAFYLYRVSKAIRNPDLAVVTLEIVILAALGCLPAGAPDFAITICVAFAASAQTAVLREVDGHQYNSTYTTGNLRTLSENAFAWLFEGRKSASWRVMQIFSIICGTFFAGAVLGAFLTPHLHNRLLWLICLPLGYLSVHLVNAAHRR